MTRSALTKLYSHVQNYNIFFLFCVKVSAKCDLTEMAVKFVSPTSYLSQMPEQSIPASSLRLNKHFAFMEEWDENVTKNVLKMVTAEIKRVVSDGDQELFYTVAVAKCKCNIYDSLRRLLKMFGAQNRDSEWFRCFIYSWFVLSCVGGLKALYALYEGRYVLRVLYQLPNHECYINFRIKLTIGIK